MSDTINTVTAIIDGVTYNLTYNATTGKYEASGIAPSASSHNLSGGYYPVSVTATYLTNVSSTVNDQTTGAVGQGCRLVVKETTKPTINITYPTAGQFITSAAAQRIEIVLRDNTVQTSGYSGVDLATFGLTVGNRTLTSTDFTATEVTGGYNLVYTPATPFDDGPYTITASVEDYDGNVSETASVSFVIDTAPPELSVSAPANGMHTASSSVAITGYTSDSGGLPVAISVTLNEGSPIDISVNSSGSFEYTLTLEDEGDQTIIVTATDSSGKTSIVQRAIYYSTAEPEITSVEIVPNPSDSGATFLIKVAVH